MALFKLKKRNELNNLSPELNQRIEFSMVNHVFKQGGSGLLASLFCSTIVFFGVRNEGNNLIIILWLSTAILVTLFRMIVNKIYREQKKPEKHIAFWRNLYIVGAILGGATWGFLGLVIFPQVGSTQQTLCILIIAGVTAGAVPLLSAIFDSIVLFLLLAILPLILSVIMQKNIIYELFDFTLMAYLVFLLIISFRTYIMIRDIMTLKLENEELVVEMSEINSKLDVLATHDPLTHVANTTLFYHELSSALNKADRTKNSLGILFIDLDKFKQANDQYGHQTGDRVLLLVIEKLQKTIRSRDLIARMGGDEFVIMLEDISSVQNIEMVARKICESIAVPMHISGIQIDISASIGISIYPNDGNNIDALLKNADHAMYDAKNHGGNRYQFYNTLIDKK